MFSPGHLELTRCFLGQKGYEGDTKQRDEVVYIRRQVSFIRSNSILIITINLIHNLLINLNTSTSTLRKMVTRDNHATLAKSLEASRC